MSLFNLPRTERDKIAAWTACEPLQKFDPAIYRVDAHGNIIRWADYGTQSEYGWEIDHILPSAMGGADHTANYRALHWRTNRSLGGQLGNALRV